MKLAYFLATALTLSAMAAPAFAAGDVTSNPTLVKPGTYALDPAHGKITWSINHLGFSTYVGQFGNVTGTLKLDPADLAKTTLNVSVDITSIGTLNPKLDEELKGDKFFNAAKFPTATYVSTKIVRTGVKTAEVYGNLTLLGITKPQVLHITFNQAGTIPMLKVYDAGFEAKAVLKRSDFGFTVYEPYLGDDVTLDIEGEFHLQP